MPKHTPGPWTVQKIEATEWNVESHRVLGSNNDLVTDIDVNSAPDDTTAAANARLIAAAPDLLDALKLAYVEGTTTDCLKYGADSCCGKCWICVSRAAIAKAG